MNKIQKFLIGSAATGLLLASAVGVFAANSAHSFSDLLSNGNNWQIWSVMPDTSKFWDINKADLVSGAVQFPFSQFEGTTTGSFAVYLKNKYNVDLTGKTITAEVRWTEGEYRNRGTGLADAYVRLEFQDVASGNYTSNDYWWFTGTSGNGVADLNGDTSSVTLTGDLKDRTLWTNLCGQRADDVNAHPGSNCVGGTDPNVSPFDGFTNAMKNVKEVNLSFGRASRYASGVAWNGDLSTQAVFNMTSFTITP